MNLPDGVDPSRTAFFLDFDGTLCEIVERPDAVEVTARTRQAVHRLVDLAGGAVALISGRRLDDLDRHLGLDLAAAGSHGAELRRKPGGSVERSDEAVLLDGPAERIGAFAEEHGLAFEKKVGALTLHYRSDPDRADQSRALIDDEAAAEHRLRAIHGNMVAELAVGGIDKGTALDRFMDHPPFAGRTPFFAGDDTTDEDAVRAAQARGGLAIRVGPGETEARYRARDTAEFTEWLARLTEQKVQST